MTVVDLSDLAKGEPSVSGGRCFQKLENAGGIFHRRTVSHSYLPVAALGPSWHPLRRTSTAFSPSLLRWKFGEQVVYMEVRHRSPLQCILSR